MSLSRCHCRLGQSASIDFSRLECEENRRIFDTNPGYLHLDVIDGQFFSPVTVVGSEMVKSLRERLPDAFLDVHLMVEDPEKWVDEMPSAGANQFIFHIEATKNPSELIRHVQNKHMKVGIGIKPATPVEDVLPYVSEVDTVLLMSTEPGLESQEDFSNNISLKVEALRQKCPNLLVKTDGWEELSKPQLCPGQVSSNHQGNLSNTREDSSTTASREDLNSSLTVSYNAKSGLLSTNINHDHDAASVSKCYGTFDSTAAGNGIKNDSHMRWSANKDTAKAESKSFIINKTNVESSQLQNGSVKKCECHVKVEDKTARRAKIKLVLACVIALLFMIGEVLGGYFSGSLAIMTDAAHMLSDFAGFLISLFALWLASRPSSNRLMSFGWHRAEVMGAVISVLIIWVITGVLFYEAVQRAIDPDRYKIDADIMLITSCVGVYVNVLMCTMLHSHSHSHGHGRNNSSGHSEEDGITGNLKDTDPHDSGTQKRRFWQRRKKQDKSGSEENINVRAAFIHAIGDLLQSVGVVTAGYIIKFKPEWKIADPICTFIFCVLVMISTLNVLKDALRVLMEGTPKHVDYEEMKRDLISVPGVRNAHSLHIWSLTLNKTALAAHLVVDSSADHQTVLDSASQMLKEQYNITSTTLQVEDHKEQMEQCDTCQEDDKTTLCTFGWPL